MKSPLLFTSPKAKSQASSTAVEPKPTPTRISQVNLKFPNELTPQDLDELIAYQRKARASYESGMKVKKREESPKVDLVALGLMKAKVEIKKRKL
jgi:hypothetical protein